jgi:PAS domain S-box-containing protein
VSLWTAPLHDTQNKVIGFVGMLVDMTERMRAETALRESEERYRSLFHNNHAVMLLIDPQSGQIIDANPAACAFYGYSLAQLNAMRITQINTLPPQQVAQEMERARLGQRWYFNFQHQLASGEIRDVEVYSGPIFVHHRLLLYSIVHDVSERRRLETQLAQSNKIAALGQMAGGIAHEVRNPLAIISANAQLLLDHPTDTELHTECAQRIYEATRRASRIIEGLLKFARPSSSTLEAVNVRRVLEETLALLANQITLQHVSLQKEFAPDLPAVWGNAGLLQQVFINLILNACTAMPSGGTLTIGTRPVAGRSYIEAWVRDTGVGITPEHLSHIFDPFFTTRPAGQGTGLGLAISYSILQQIQGTIEAESCVGQGSTFTVRLPHLEGA